MCPFCIGATTWVALAGVSTGGALAVGVKLRRGKAKQRQRPGAVAQGQVTPRTR